MHKLLTKYLILILVTFCLPQLGMEVLGQSGRKVLGESPTNGVDGAKDEDILKVKTEEVLLPVSVRDLQGTPVSGLKEDRFLIFDNGVRQKISSFNNSRVPANIVLLLDASSSVFSRMKFIRSAAKQFLEGLIEGDKVCVAQFSDRVELLQDWTPSSNLKALVKSLDWRYHPGMRTTFYDGLYLAAVEKLRAVEGRKVVILLTDGMDTAEKPRASYGDALNAVRRAEASVYVISLTASIRSELEGKVGKSKLGKIFSGYDRREISLYLAMIDRSEKTLNDLAMKTGGRIFYPLKDSDLTESYLAIAEELRTQYIITYKPQPGVREGEYRRIRVLVINGDYEVGAREGYTGRL